jgi:hypothetical protein
MLYSPQSLHQALLQSSPSLQNSARTASPGPRKRSAFFDFLVFKSKKKDSGQEQTRFREFTGFRESV